MGTDKLPQKVREAIDEIDDCMRMDIKVVPVGALGVVRAELLRLAEIEEERWAVVATRNGALERAEKAEAELAALKARIAEAPSVMVEFSITGGWWINTDKRGYVPQALNGKRVRLVVEE